MDQVVWKPRIIEISDIFISLFIVFERFDIDKHRKSATILKTGFLQKNSKRVLSRSSL